MVEPLQRSPGIYSKRLKHALLEFLDPDVGPSEIFAEMDLSQIEHPPFRATCPVSHMQSDYASQNEPVQREESCQRCNEKAATQSVRLQKFCDDCFIHFVQTRAIKRLESLRQHDRSSTPFVKGVKPDGPPEPDSYLVAVSGGTSSLCLLHILDAQIRRMMAKSGRSNLCIHVLHVTGGLASSLDAKSSTASDLREAFPDHQYTDLPLADVLKDWTPPSQLATESSQKDDPNNPTIDPSAYASDTSISDDERLDRLLSRAKSPTARIDLLNSLLYKSITNFATKHKHKTILMADSATRLAERILGDTAKGRGGSLPSLLSESYQPSNTTEAAEDAAQGLRTAFPLRDVLRVDLTAYARAATLPGTDAPLASLLASTSQTVDGGGVPAPTKVTMMKDLSIDELMARYFADVEGNYPGVVSSVVKTVGKLDSTAPVGARRCEVCASFVDKVGPGTLGSAEDGQGTREVVDGLCTRCERDFGES